MLSVPVMRAFTKANIPRAFAIASLLGAALTASLSAMAVVIPPGGLAATNSGNDLILSFPTTTPRLYTVQTTRDLAQWSNVPPGIPGDGHMKTVWLSNAISGGQGFYRLLIQTPAGLLISQSAAFTILGYDCGGIQEHAYVTGFDPTTGYPVGDVYLRTSCSTGKAGSPPAIHTNWTAVTWDFAGNAISVTALSNAPAVNTNFMATDAYGDTIYNTVSAAYLIIPLPGPPTGVTAAQSGDEIQVSWIPGELNQAAITSSTLTATPTDPTNSILTTTVTGSATSGAILSVEPQTTYQITIVNTAVSGSSPPSAPVSVTTSPATVAPSAPTNVTASWSNPDPSGTNDTLIASWQAPDPGNSPIDEYLITITGSDGGGTFTQTVSGTTLTTYFTVDYIPNWSVTVQAHNAAGWGPVSSVFRLGGL